MEIETEGANLETLALKQDTERLTCNDMYSVD